MKFLKEIALAVAIMLTVFSSFVYIVSAQQVLLPSGGVTSAYVPANLACPFDHTIVVDYITFQPIGLAIIPGFTQIYAKGNVQNPGVYILAQFVPTLLPCVLPYPVVPTFQIGTS